ncbi:MAG: hypothetical protein Q8O46_02880 [bacterium]|nr:hypothetical protein [bacterium]
MTTANCGSVEGGYNPDPRFMRHCRRPGTQADGKCLLHSSSPVAITGKEDRELLGALARRAKEQPLRRNPQDLLGMLVGDSVLCKKDLAIAVFGAMEMEKV